MDGYGVATSLLSALFGVGGSTLLVPVLHLLCRCWPHSTLRR